jgi:hypothetical protein
VVCTACRARLLPPRQVPAGQPILCPKCRTIFAAPGALRADTEQPIEAELVDDGWEVLPEESVIVRPPPVEVEPVVVRRPSRRNDRRQEDRRKRPVAIRPVHNSRDRHKRHEAFWIAVTLGSICGLGLIGIVLLLIFARPVPPDSHRTQPGATGRQRLGPDVPAQPVP